MASTEQKKREETKAMGVFLDDITNVQVSADASPVGDVAHSVAGLVIDNINRKFGLDPPLANDNMDVAWIPNVAADTDISSLDEGFITLVKLNERTSPRVRSRLLENVNSSKVVESESIAQLRIEMLSQIGSLKTKADSQGKEINKLSIANTDLKANVNTLLKKANLQDKEIAHLKASNAELKTSNTELKTSNTELKTSNTELAATSAQHSKIIGKLRRRIVLDDARKKLTIDYPNTASLQSETFSLNELHNSLSQEHSDLLSLDALRVIFDSSENTVRSQGNIAAHEAPQEELAFSVLSTDINGKRRKLLASIYRYAYSGDPEFPELDA